MNLQGHAHIQPHETAWLEGATHLHALLDLSLHDDILTPIREGLACLKRLATEQLQSEEKKWGLRTSSNQTWKDKLEWCLYQRHFREGTGLEKELLAWSHPKPASSPTSITTVHPQVACSQRRRRRCLSLRRLRRRCPMAARVLVA